MDRENPEPAVPPVVLDESIARLESNDSEVDAGKRTSCQNHDVLTVIEGHRCRVTKVGSRVLDVYDRDRGSGGESHTDPRPGVPRSAHIANHGMKRAVEPRRETRAVLLDLDDTLTDRWATVQLYARQFLTDFGSQFRVSDVAAVAAEIAYRDRNGYNHDRALDLAEHEAWISSPGADVLAAHWDRHFADCTQASAGLLSTIGVLEQAGIRLGVVTNGQTDRQRRKIEALGLRRHLTALLISEELGIEKPDARIFRAAAAALGVDPAECMFVGDNPEKDVLGASAVGMRAVWIRVALRWPQGVALPRESVGSLPELLQLPGLLGTD